MNAFMYALAEIRSERRKKKKRKQLSMIELCVCAMWPYGKIHGKTIRYICSVCIFPPKSALGCSHRWLICFHFKFYWSSVLQFLLFQSRLRLIAVCHLFQFFQFFFSSHFVWIDHDRCIVSKMAMENAYFTANMCFVFLIFFVFFFIIIFFCFCQLMFFFHTHWRASDDWDSDGTLS